MLIGYWALVDLLLALLPITFIYSMQISWKRKFVLGMLLGLGIFAAVCAAIKVAHIRTQTTDADVTWDTNSLIVWNTTEANVIIYAACLPTVSELLKRFFEMIACHIAHFFRFRKLPSTADTHPMRNGIQLVRLRTSTDTGTQGYQVEVQSWTDEVAALRPAEAVVYEHDFKRDRAPV